MSIGFTFDSIHSSEFNVYFKSVDRTLLPAKRLTQYTVPGKSGTYDVVHGYENRTIQCTIGFTGDDYTREGLRQKAREVSQWLSGEGDLVFDDELDKAYVGKVISGINIEEVARTGKCNVTFLCNSFAYSVEYCNASVNGAVLPETVDVDVQGTQETPCNIYILAKEKIESITITKKTVR